MGGLQAKIGITISPGVWMMGKRGRRGRGTLQSGIMEGYGNILFTSKVFI